MKKIMKLAFVAAIAAVAGYNVYQSQSVMNGMSDFALANVEALARGETGTYTGLIYLSGEYGTGGCISCSEPNDSNCTCK